MQSTRPTCVIADRFSIVLEGLMSRFTPFEWPELVASATSGHAALRAILERRPDLAILDLHLPGVDGIDIARELARNEVPTRVVIFSAVTDRSIVERAFEGGVAGYLGKEAPPELMLRAIEMVLGGRRYIDPIVAADLLTPHPEGLSTREWEILRLMGEGLSNRLIGERLEITEQTVKTHVSRIMDKMEVQTRTEAVAAAFRRSLIA